MKINQDGTIEVVPAVVKTVDEVLGELDTKLQEWNDNQAYHQKMADAAKEEISVIEAQRVELKSYVEKAGVVEINNIL